MIIVPTEKRFDWKHTPVILILIVLANILIFFLYQSGDDKKIESAMALYQKNGLFKQEWPLFKQYLIQIKDPSLDEHENAYKADDIANLSYAMISRGDFYNYLKADAFELIGYYSVDEWAGPRRTIHEKMMSVSYIAHGLQLPDFKAHQLITHQFLHGGLMHLLGNLIFLIICGFAVEAAIGHWRFALFYIASGVAGGLAHVLFHGDTHSTLVGASGSISGVMAMYLGIFRFKKIEFFYWFFVFVGYIRVPALLVFPFYIGKEIYSFYTNEASNVAFMAHAGGFVAGALLVGALILMKRDMLNEEYIEEDQDLDTGREELTTVYKHLENYKFTQALHALETIIKEQGRQFDLLLLRVKICSLLNTSINVKAFEKLALTNANNIKEARQLQRHWLEHQELHEKVSTKAKLALASTLIDNHISEGVEKIFNELDSGIQSKDIEDKNNENTKARKKLSAKLAIYYGTLGNKVKSQHYRKISEDIAMETT